MFWASIIGSKIIGTFKVNDGAKINAKFSDKMFLDCYDQEFHEYIHVKLLAFCIMQRSLLPILPKNFKRYQIDEMASNLSRY